MARRASRGARGREPLDLYGDVVGAALARRPSLARDALRAGFDFTAWRVSHLPDKEAPLSSQHAAELFFTRLTGALDHPESTAVTSLFLPTEVFQALGASPVCAEALAGTCAGAHAEAPFVAAAEGAGIPETYCSYHKVLMGMATSGVLPPPRMLASCSVACDANNLTFKTLADLWGVPHFYVDVPYEVTRESALYVAEQFRGLARAAEECFGRRLDEAELSACVARSQRTLALFDRSVDLRRGRYLAGDLMGHLMGAVNAQLALGTTAEQLVATQLCCDLKAAPASRGLDLVWVHTAPFFLAPLTSHLDRNPDAQVIATDMELCCPGGEAPWFGPDEPFEAMAERIVRNCYNGPAERRVARVRELARRSGADGVVVFSHWGCKHTAGASQIIRAELEEAGFPTLVLDGDGGERQNNMDGQMRTRFEAFLELLRTRREERDDS